MIAPPRVPRKIDPVGLVALVDQGLGVHRIARVFGVTPSAVSQFAHRWGVLLQGPLARLPGGAKDRAEAAHERALARGHAAYRPKVDPAELARLIAQGLRVAELERALGVHRATLHRTARAHGLELPKRATRTPDRAGWVVLIVEHGLSVPALAEATGLRRDYVRGLLVEHGLLETWWGRRGARYAEWTLGDEY